MKLINHILVLSALASLIACGKIDPESVADPVVETPHRIVKLSVGTEPDTKVNINIEEDGAGNKQGVVTFTTEDVLNLFKFKGYNNGSISISMFQSKETSLKNNGRGAEFTFDLPEESVDKSCKYVGYFAAIGDWGIDDNNAVVYIPGEFTISDDRVLPEKGVIAKSDAFIGKPADDLIDLMSKSSVPLEHLVGYCILGISGLDGKNIDKITVKTNPGIGAPKIPIAGKATIQIKYDTNNFSDSPENQVSVSPLNINDDSTNTLTIYPSTKVRESFYKGTPVNVWFSSLIQSSTMLTINAFDSTAGIFKTKSIITPIIAGQSVVLDVDFSGSIDFPL